MPGPLLGRQQVTPVSPPKTSPAPLGRTARLYHRTAVADNRSLAAPPRSAARVRQRLAGGELDEACLRGESRRAFRSPSGIGHPGTQRLAASSESGLARTRAVEWPGGSRVEMMRRITPVIMCGGAGTRLWPSSRESFPKQFIPFFGPRSSFQDTVLRVSDPSLFGEPVIITGRDYSHLVADQLEGVGRTGTILLEPMRRDSGPAIAAAASFVRKRDPGSLLLVMAADHVIRDIPAFLAAVCSAGDAAAEGYLMLFGITPDRPATGYGYIQPSATRIGQSCFKVEAYVEKPDFETAKAYIAKGYLWNSGNFI